MLAGAIVMTLALSGLARRVHAAALPDILKLHNVQPLQPPPQAPSFTLPTVDGQSLSLDKFRGRWVLLTFFATWCGPCAAEMPSLQAVYDEMRGKGLDVLAVAVDPEDDIAGYVRKRKLSFPVVLDIHGQAASTYQASSIPITYLMDPSGKLVGVAQGARDWQAASTLIDALMREVPVSASAPSQTPTAANQPADIVPASPPDKRVPLPSNVVPPEARAELEEAQVEARKPFHVNITVQWAGSLRDYILLPPSVSLPHNVRDLGTSATTSTDTGRATLVYRLTLVSDVPQTIKLDPVEVRYQPAGQQEPLSRHIAGPTIDVQPMRLLGMTQIQVVLASVGASLLIGGGILLLVVRALRRDKRKRAAIDSQPHDTSLGTLETARRARMDGDVSAFMRCMTTLLPEPPELRAEVASLSEGVRYGGAAPDATTLDRLLRAAERRVQTLTLASAPQSRAEQSP